MYIFHTLVFEFDSKKSHSNKTKHGVDLVEAQRIWEDPHVLVLPARTVDEPRLTVVGRVGSSVLSAIVTYRGDRIRIISARRSRTEEIELYES